MTDSNQKAINKLKKKQINDQLPKDQITQEFKNGVAIITTKSLNIKSDKEALAYSKIDLNEWKMDRCVVDSKEITMGVNVTGTGKPETYTNYQVKVWLKARANPTIETAISSFFKQFKSAKYPKIKYSKIKTPNLLEICLFDHHFGKLAWRKETLEDYDLKIAKTLYQKAVENLLSKAQNFNIEKIVFPIGQDFFHIDNEEAKTPRGGNHLDTDARLAKVFETGLWACIKAIETCLVVAPVDIVWVPGNHDPKTSYYLCKTLEHHFLNSKNVTVNVKPTYRKYIRYGISLIGYTHGSEEAIGRLPLIMADETGRDWSETKFHEFHIGHTHKKREVKFLGADSEGSVIIRVLPSLSGTDQWHYKKGFVGGVKSAEAYIWSKKEGYGGHFPSNQI